VAAVNAICAPVGCGEATLAVRVGVLHGGAASEYSSFAVVS